MLKIKKIIKIKKIVLYIFGLLIYKKLKNKSLNVNIIIIIITILELCL